MPARIISLDTETTGLDFKSGDRVIEIGAVEIIGRSKTNNTFQTYLNPQGKEISEGAKAITNISDEDLAAAPKFIDIADNFISFIKGAELVIHNSEFDLGFLNNELRLMDHTIKDISEICKVYDSLIVARKTFPGQKNSLDALSARLGVTGYDRKHHGALLDAQILSDVYLNLTGGQVALTLSQSTKKQNTIEENEIKHEQKAHLFKASQNDQKKHDEYLNFLKEKTGEEIKWET